MDYTFDRRDLYLYKNGERVRKLKSMNLYEDDDSVERDLVVKFDAYIRKPDEDDTFKIKESVSSSSEEGYDRELTVTRIPRTYNYQSQPHSTILWGTFDD